MIKIIFKIKNNYVHRENGPAIIESAGITQYRVAGMLHNINGPAFINKVCKSHFLNGKYYTEEQYYEKLK